MSILLNKKDETFDASKKFTNIDTEDFECTWDGVRHFVKAGETVDKPKYLVNYMAKHLARKIVKREAFNKFKKENPKGELGKAEIKIRDQDKEEKLQKKMVKENFPKVKEKKDKDNKDK